MASPRERARALIDRNLHMTLATADAVGTPWVSPVLYVPDDEYDLYWVSDEEARHSENIRINPVVAITIFETQPVAAVYIAADAREINDPDEARRAIRVLERRSQPEKWVTQELADVIGNGPWRIYRATPKTIEVRKEIEKKNKPVVVREPADFRPDIS